jgi:hypothetical protein
MYEGAFKDGKMHGKGKLTGTDGNVYEGEFKDGVPVPIVILNNK